MRAVATEIALQTHTLTTCPVHNEIFCDDEVDPSVTFALGWELVREGAPCVSAFEGDAHALAELLSDVIGAAPVECRCCTSTGGGRTPAAPLELHLN